MLKASAARPARSIRSLKLCSKRQPSYVTPTTATCGSAKAMPFVQSPYTVISPSPTYCTGGLGNCSVLARTYRLPVPLKPGGRFKLKTYARPNFTATEIRWLFQQSHNAGLVAVLAVPMFKEDQLVGVIAIYSKQARIFTDKQIDTCTKLRRPGRYCHREHTAFQRVARVAGAADRDLRRAEGHLKLARGPRAGLRHHAG